MELGQITVSDFAAKLLGHTEALERVPYRELKEAQMVRAQLEHAIRRGEADLVDVHRLSDWLREWAGRVPVSER
jgi:hypothetical protein